MDPLSDPSISPYKVRSITRALNANGMEADSHAINSSSATTAANTGTIASRLTTIHNDLTETNRLLQAILDK